MSSKQNQRPSTRRTKARETSEPAQSSLPLRYKKSHIQNAVLNEEKVIDWYIIVPTQDQALKDKKVPKYAPFEEWCIGKLVITCEVSNTEANDDMMEQSDDEELKQVVYTRFLIPTFQQPVSVVKGTTQGVAESYFLEKDGDGKMLTKYTPESLMKLAQAHGVMVHTTLELYDKPTAQPEDCLETFFLPFKCLNSDWLRMSSTARQKRTVEALNACVNQHYKDQREPLPKEEKRHYPKTIPDHSLKKLAATLCIYQAGGYHKYVDTTDRLQICMLPEDTAPKDFRYVL